MFIVIADSTWNLILNILLFIVMTVILMLVSKSYVHMLQLESYQNKMYLKWILKNSSRSMLPLATIATAALALRIVVNAVTGAMGELGGIIAFAANIAAFILICCKIVIDEKSKPARKPLVYTGRVKRLYLVLAIVYLALFYLTNLLNATLAKSHTTIFNGMGTNLLLYLIPFAVLLSALIIYPVEEGMKSLYFNDAQKKLKKRTDLIKIGITGSFGKTSSKFILESILKEKYNAIATPNSYNTPMGVTRVIREMLKPEHEVFIAEMGARYAGDIAELCRLVKPVYGLITSVGKQHLETFKSLEKVIETKYELIESLPENGVAFFNADNGICSDLYAKTTVAKRLYGIKNGNTNDVWANDIRTSPSGSDFTLFCAEGSVHCKTALLGTHNIVNILGACAVARELGMTLEEIARGVSKIQPVEHRLQLIPAANGMTIIDDAFNSNPEGAKAALEVLAEFEGRKIVVTPGMVELGDEEETQNELLGERIADVASYCIIVGKSFADYIYKGLKKKGFPERSVLFAKDLDAATIELSKITKPGDIVLFENDLPDNFA